MKRVAVHTLGCKLNFAESSTIARQFRDRGYEVVGVDDRADVCVINTCTVTDRADRECRQIVRRALRHSPNAYVIVTGCYAQLRPEQIAEIPGVDLVLGTKEKFEAFQHGHDFVKSECTRSFVSPLEGLTSFDPASSMDSLDRTRAFLKVQDGCDYTCAFCTIPLARGASRCIPISSILEEAKEVVRRGYREIVLTGVNVGDYGRKIGTSLAKLLSELAQIDELSRIRVSSVEPNLLTDELLAAWGSNSKICRHFHLPLQGGNDIVLRGMRRRYLAEDYTVKVMRIRQLFPDAGIGADVIAGFPGETESLFEETYKFLLDLPISYLHVFTYSARPNTAALSLAGKVESRVRFQRSDKLRLLGMRKRLAFHCSLTGSTREVLFEERLRDGYWSGLTGEYARVKVPHASDLSNCVANVRITSVEGENCIGQIIDTSSESTMKPCTNLDEVPSWA
jgi:threonylcarbamoyladenosine tRNA methylthiotransferase MtaB